MPIPDLTDLLPEGAKVAHNFSSLEGLVEAYVTTTAPHHLALIDGARERGCTVSMLGWTRTDQSGARSDDKNEWGFSVADGDVVRLRICYELRLFR